jgi:hypothetical protein
MRSWAPGSRVRRFGAAREGWCLGLAVGVLAAAAGALEPSLGHDATEKPLLTIVYSADIDGYLEPCGCGGVKEGGIARQATLLKQLREQGAVLAISGGGFGSYPEAVSVMLRALSLMNYDLVIPSPHDLQTRPDVQTLADQMGLRTELAQADGSLTPTIMDAEGARVGVVTLATESDAIELPAGLAETCDVLVAVARTTGPTVRGLCEQLGELPTPSVLLRPPDQAAGSGDIHTGSCVAPAVPTRGRGLVEVVLARDADGSVRVAVAPRIVTPSIAADAQVQLLVEDYYSARRRWASTTNGVARAPDGEVIDTESAYVTAAQCAECHESEYAAWSSGMHSEALSTLQDADRTIPECLKCHSTAFASGAYVDGDASATGVECASCHGDGVLHGVTRLTSQVSVPTEQVCRGCHTLDDSPHFDAAGYLDQLGCRSSEQAGRAE